MTTVSQEIKASSKNFANADLTFTGNREHLLGSYNLDIYGDDVYFWLYDSSLSFGIGVGQDEISSTGSNITIATPRLSIYGNTIIDVVSSGVVKTTLGGTLSTDSVGIWNSDGTVPYHRVLGNGTNIVGSTSGGRLDIGEVGGGATYANLYFNSNTFTHVIQAYNNGLDIRGAYYLRFYSGVSVFSQIGGDNMYLYDGKNFQFATTTGTKIGTASNEKIAFWGAVPIVRPVESALSNVPNSGDANTDALITALKNIIINTGLGSAV